MAETIEIKPATERDVAGMLTLLEAFRDDPSLFRRSEAELRHLLGDFVIAREAGGRIVGCAGVHRYTSTLGEVYSVAVLPECQGLGVGSRLVQACESQAVRRGIPDLWLGTLKPRYFARFGYRPISLHSLPVVVRLLKLLQLLRQPPTRWRQALFGRYVIMRRDPLKG